MKTKLLLLLILANFSIYAQTNLVTNPGFETFSGNIPQNWTITNSVTSSTDAATGQYSARLSFTTVSPKIITQVPMKAGVTYTVKFKYKFVSSNYGGDHPIALNISKNGSNSTLSSSTFATNNLWTEKANTFTPDQDLSYDLSISTFSFDSANFTVLIDDVQVYVQGTEQYTLIPDVNFEKKLIALGIDSGTPDGKVPTGNINKLTSLDVSYSSITDLTGIQDFTSLTGLFTLQNKLVTLDVSKNVNLTILRCDSNTTIETLNVSENTKLTQLYCGNNKIKNLNLSKLTALRELSCDKNQLTNIDLSTNIQLEKLYIDENQLTKLDLSKNTALKYLNCRYNRPMSELNLKNGKNNLIDKNSLLLTGNNSLTCILVDDVAYSNTNWEKSKDSSVDFSLVCSTPEYTLIPDAEFEKKIIANGYDLVQDGKVLTRKIAAAEYLSLDDAPITDLTGLEVFTNLKTLYCSKIKVSSYDFSKNTQLTILGFNSNNVESIDVSNLLKLKTLELTANNLTSIDVSKNLALETLYINKNKFTEINFSANKNLATLICSNNPITKINIAENPALIYLYCSTASITNLNITNNLALKGIEFERNAITDIDVSKNTALEFLNCAQNPISSLNLTNNKNLQILNCSGNYYQSGIGGSGKITTLNLYNNPLLTSLDCSSNQLSKLDLSSNPKIVTLRCYGNILTDLDLSKNSDLKQVSANSNRLKSINFKNGNNTKATILEFQSNPNLDCIQVDDVSYANSNWSTKKDASTSYSNSCPLVYTAIPDIEFEKKLISLGLDSGATDGKVLTSNIKTVKSLTVDTRVISDLTGIQDFEALETLSATGSTYSPNGNADGKLTKLDVSKNINLISLNCTANNLTSLDVSKNTKLTTLIFNGNKIANIDITKNLSLQLLAFDSTLISTIDISKHQSLTTFNCSYTNITTIDVSKNTGLRILSVSGNKITTLDVSKNINLTSLNCEVNKLTSIDVSKNLGLLNFSCFGNPLTTIDLSNNISLERVNFSTTAITTIDLSKNINLLSVTCGSAQLNTIDVSKNLKLNYFNASHSQFKNLDLSKNINLTTVFCQFNQVLNEINLKNGNNTKLTNGNVALNGNPSLYCIQVDDVNYSTQNWTKKDASVDYTAGVCSTPSYTLIPDAEFEKLLIEKEIDGVQDGKVLTNRIAKIKVLNLSNTNTKYKIQDLTGIEDFEALEELKFPNNYEANVATVNVSKNQFLKKLDCRQSGIITLDVSKNTALTDLNCYGNKLTSLDVSKNSALTTLDCSYNRLTALDVTNNINLKSLSCSSSNKEGVFSLQQGLLTSLDVSKNSALEFLDCSMNEKLVGLDVSKNSNLTSINVSNNNLTSIDFSANKLLKSISCENNQITSLDLSKYPALESLRCSYNQLTLLDVSQKPGLKVLMCSYNQLTNLDVSKNPALETFYCDNNKLTILDLSANPNLKQIICSSNNLTKLNLKNGSNKKVSTTIFSTFANNPNLSCITVDDVDYANKTWAAFKDTNASYNTECGFSLPSKNFTVESKGESCLGENNGVITITASEQLPYVANINGKTSSFTNNTLKVSSLTPGTYTILVTIPGEIYEQNFTVSIAKGATITGKSSITSKTVDVEITEGTAPFTVFVDGAEQFKTNEAVFSVDVTKNALVEVATAKACEGVFAKKVSVSDFDSQILSAYPNPTSGSFEIEIPSAKKEVKIELYNFSGQLVSAKTYLIENGKALLNLENQPSGIYAAKIYLDTPEYIKIIKK